MVTVEADLSLTLMVGTSSCGDISWSSSSRSASGVALRARPDPQVHQLVILHSSEKSSSVKPNTEHNLVPA